MPPRLRSTAPLRRNRSSTPPGDDWRCTCCGKLLGVCRDGRLHIRVERGSEYLTALPATATCRGCRTLNRLSSPQA